MRVASLLALTIAACRPTHEGLSLSEASRARCHDLAMQLQHAATDYGVYATAAQPSFEQQRRAAIELPYGLAPKERGIAAIALHDDLQFCATIRSAPRVDPLRESLTQVTGRLRTRDEPAEIARAVEDLARIAKEASTGCPFGIRAKRHLAVHRA